MFRDLDEHPEDEQIPGVAVIRLDGGLFFATSDALEDRVRDVVQASPDLSGIVLDCEGVDFVDSQGSSKVHSIIDLADEAGVTLRLARVKPGVRVTLARDGVLERLGDGRIHGNVHRAVETHVASARPGSDPPSDAPHDAPDEDRA